MVPAFCFSLSGHTRYSTAGVSEMTNCQPFVVETLHGLIALGHNGELVNANPLKQKVFLQFYTPLKRTSPLKIMQDTIYNFCSKANIFMITTAWKWCMYYLRNYIKFDIDLFYLVVAERSRFVLRVGQWANNATFGLSSTWRWTTRSRLDSKVIFTWCNFH